MSLKFIATGDTIVTEYYTRDYKGYQELCDFIRTADVKFNNMETPLVDDWCTVSSFSGGHWLRSPTSLLDELTDFDFNCYSFANNHNLDFFYDGMISTLEAFEKRGLPYAGAGRNLAEATRHCKVETPNGSVSMLAFTTAFEPSAAAGPTNGKIPGRPGVSVLRHKVKYFVTEEQIKALQEIADGSVVNGRLKNRQALGSVAVSDSVFPFDKLEFAVGEPGRMTYGNPYDIKRLEEAVKAAVADADRCVLYIHTHETKGARDDEPDYFVEEFARRAIDLGAKAVICSGTHQVKAVEIYKGVPIYYSIANFFFRPHDLTCYPKEWFEKYDLDPNLSIEEAENIRSKGGTRGLMTQAYNFQAMMPVIEWDDAGNCTKIAAMPISLGFDTPETKGFPRLADKAVTEALYAKLTACCEEYGTKVTLGEDGMFYFLTA